MVLLGIFVVGLTAQFVKPLGDALQGKAALGGALLSLVGYVLYDAVQELSNAPEVMPEQTLVGSHSLREHVRRAFAAREVTVSFFGYTGETLFSELHHQLELLMEDPGRTRKVTIRMMVPDFSLPMSVPGRVGATGVSVDDPEFRRRVDGRCEDYDQQFSDLSRQLDALGRVAARCEYRQYQGLPREKICIFNEELVLHGRYDISARYAHQGQDMYDPKGYNTDLFVWSKKVPAQVAVVDRWVRDLDGEWRLAARPAWSHIPAV
ncbi:hypothetical protein [Streptomyces sp. NBC_01465]|uniref:hypothetical protein n=1 Tax=Streptomyces sp. NBC_01465 TaxID=2903878 RepID=UPI002E35D93A|nr:hypothetical protein [Streptomyces sp. NBC_01465]